MKCKQCKNSYQSGFIYCPICGDILANTLIYDSEGKEYCLLNDYGRWTTYFDNIRLMPLSIYDNVIYYITERKYVKSFNLITKEHSDIGEVFNFKNIRMRIVANSFGIFVYPLEKNDFVMPYFFHYKSFEMNEMPTYFRGATHFYVCGSKLFYSKDNEICVFDMKGKTGHSHLFDKIETLEKGKFIYRGSAFHANDDYINLFCDLNKNGKIWKDVPCLYNIKSKEIQPLPSGGKDYSFHFVDMRDHSIYYSKKDHNGLKTYLKLDLDSKKFIKEFRPSDSYELAYFFNGHQRLNDENRRTFALQVVEPNGQVSLKLDDDLRYHTSKIENGYLIAQQYYDNGKFDIFDLEKKVYVATIDYGGDLKL